MGKLTKAMIDQARTDSVDLFLWESTLPGFGVRVRRTGLKSFIIQYRNRLGRSCRVTLGRYGVLTLDQARGLAQDELARARTGEDPQMIRRRGRSKVTVADLAERYIREYGEARCKPATLRAYRWLTAKFILPAIGTLRLVDLRPSDVEALHQSLKATRYNANQVLGLLRAMLSQGEKWGYIPRHSNPAQDIRKFREQSRQRFLAPEEIARLLAALDRLAREGATASSAANLFWLLLLTGARLNELRPLRWTQVDWHRQAILLDEHKADTHGRKAIALNDTALAILRQVQLASSGPVVFPGRSPDRPIAGVQVHWDRARRAANLDGVRIHDLRHTFASLALASGAPLPVIGAALGHRSLSSTKIYAHLTQAQIHNAATLVGHHVAALLKSS